MFKVTCQSPEIKEALSLGLKEHLFSRVSKQTGSYLASTENRTTNPTSGKAS
jgi:hypothetical protein